MTPIENGFVTALRRGFHGQVLVEGDQGYDAAREIWNGMFDRRPAVIAQCADTGDVVRAVQGARDEGLVIAVKGGGHNSAGYGVGDGGLTIDLSAMRRVEVENGAVRVGGGALLSDLDKATSVHGRAVPAGIMSETGVGGLTLGGGFGWISRKYGLTVDNLLSAEIVTAAGEVVTASPAENPDLFWGLRGGGGNFGIVTSFNFRSAPIGREVFSGILIKPFEEATEFLRFHREYVRSLPDEMTAYAIIRHAPPLPFLKPEMHGKMIVAVAFVGLGSADEGERHLEPIRKKGTSIAEAVGMNPWTGWQSGFDALVGHGARNYWKSHDLPDLSDGVIEAVVESGRTLPSEESQIVIPHLEGAVARVSAEETAYPHRRAAFMLNFETRWLDPRDDERCMGWAREHHESTQRFANGVYVNFLSDEGEDRVRQAYTPEAWSRLVETKRTWDPENLFRMNQNIRP